MVFNPGSSIQHLVSSITMIQRKAFPTFLAVSLLLHGAMVALLGIYPWKPVEQDKPLKVRILPESALPQPPAMMPALPSPPVNLPQSKATPKAVPPPPPPTPPTQKKIEVPKTQEPPKPRREEFPKPRDRFKPKIEEDEAPLDKRKMYSNLATGEGGKEFGMRGKGAGTGDSDKQGVGTGKGEGNTGSSNPQNVPKNQGAKPEAVNPGLGGTKEKSYRDMIASVDKYVDPKSLDKGSGGGLRGGGQGGKVSILNPGFRYSSYLAKFVEKVEGVFHYNSPEMLKREGVAVVKLLRNGQLAELKLVQSSGSKNFDEAAMSALQRAAPYAPFPPKWEDEDLTIEVIFY